MGQPLLESLCWFVSVTVPESLCVLVCISHCTVVTVTVLVCISHCTGVTVTVRCVLRADGLTGLIPTVAPPQGEGQLPLDLPHAVHQRGQRGAGCGGWGARRGGRGPRRRGRRGSHSSSSLRAQTDTSKQTHC